MIDAAYCIRHNSWATRTMLAFVAALTPAQRQLTVPGTAGAVDYCLAHIVGGEQRYLVGLSNLPVARPLRESSHPGLELVEAAHAENESVWERLLMEGLELEGWQANPLASARPTELYEHAEVRRHVLLAQAIHHANDHRTQIATILGANGVAPPQVDVWAYGNLVGDLR